MDRDCFTTFQAAKLLGVSPDTVLKWIKSGKIQASRTLGGHHRIQKTELEAFVSKKQMPYAPAPPDSDPQKAFAYCWEYHAGSDSIKEECKECLVYKTRATRCYEMNDVPKELGNLKVFCQTSCDECSYYKLVREQALNILVVTGDESLAEDLERNKDRSGFNLVVADCEYKCSAIVEQFRPDFAVVDCSFKQGGDICKHLANDPRIPYLKLILVSALKGMPDFCDKKTIARITKPFRFEQLQECINRISL